MQTEITIKVRDNDGTPLRQLSVCQKMEGDSDMVIPMGKGMVGFLLQRLLKDRKMLKQFHKECIEKYNELHS